MLTKEALEEIIWKINEKQPFSIKSSMWSNPTVCFAYPEHTDTNEGDLFWIKVQLSGIISKAENIICLLGDWSNVAEGIFFTDKTLYVNTPKNSMKKFKVKYSNITGLEYSDAGNPELKIITERQKYVIDTTMWSKRNINIFLQIVTGINNLTFEEKKRIKNIYIKTLENKSLLDISDEVEKLKYSEEAGDGYDLDYKPQAKNITGAEVAGTVYGNVSNASTIYNYDKLATPKGHGFAAEQANHLADKILNADILGNKVKLVGDDNVKNGADRIVNGTRIQTKYCKTGSKCIAECFKDGKFRYLDVDGKPMKIEVPPEFRGDAVKAMRERIKNGQVPGVTDAGEAENIVTGGHFTYNQAKNIAKAGTIESITYDSVTGAITATYSFGISTAISFATAVWNGEDIEVALQSAVHTGLKVGGTTFVVGVLSSQLAKAGLNSALVASSEAVIRAMGPKASAIMVNALRSGSNIYGAAAMKSAAKLLRGNAITAGVTVAVLSTVDIVNIFSGKISGKQLFKNITNTAATVAAGTAGWAAGAAIGTAIFPGIGTVVGTIGGLIGSAVAGTAASKAAGAIMDNFIEDDANEMVEIIQGVFVELCSEYLLNQEEAEEATDILKEKLDGAKLKEMFASDNREEFARGLIEEDIEEITGRRKKIYLPNEEKMQKTMIKVLEDIYDNYETVPVQ